MEDRRFVSDGKALGGHAVDLPLQANAMRGTWTLRIHTDPKTAAISEKSFLVDDFVPDRTEFDLSSKAKQIDRARKTAIDVDGRYLYGAPAAGLTLEGEIAIKPTRTSADFEVISSVWPMRRAKKKTARHFPICRCWMKRARRASMLI